MCFRTARSNAFNTRSLWKTIDVCLLYSCFLPKKEEKKATLQKRITFACLSPATDDDNRSTGARRGTDAGEHCTHTGGGGKQHAAVHSNLFRLHKSWCLREKYWTGISHPSVTECTAALAAKRCIGKLTITWRGKPARGRRMRTTKSRNAKSSKEKVRR